MKIIYETHFKHAERESELSYCDPTGDYSGQYVVVKLYALEDYEIRNLIQSINEGRTLEDLLSEIKEGY